ncbi:MAG: hypothetical protein SGI71_02250 [Verrucomicrobiota bacterium]|nr:hypothetical protein [Verrucomicrobiota bacterium]
MKISIPRMSTQAIRPLSLLMPLLFVLISILILIGTTWNASPGLLDEHRISHNEATHPVSDYWTLSYDKERMRPVYWTYYHFVFNTGGAYGWKFFIQTLFFIVTGCLIGACITSVTKNEVVGGGIAVLWLFQASAAENLFTLGKPEILLSFLIIASFLLANRFVRNWNWVLLAGSLCLTGMAILTKETGVVALVASFILVLGAGLKVTRQKMIAATCLHVLTGLIFVVLPRLLKPKEAAQYVTFEFSPRSVAYNLYAYLINFPELALLAGVVVCLLIGQLKKNKLSAFPHSLICASSTLLAAVSYMVILAIWRWPGGYYLLPVSLLLLLSLGFCLTEPLKTSRNVMVLLICLFVIFNIIGFVSVGYLQKQVVHLHNTMIEKAVKLSKPGDIIVLIAEDLSSEVLFETQLHVSNNLERSDLKIIPWKNNKHLILKDGDIVIDRSFENSFIRHTRYMQEVSFSAVPIPGKLISEQGFSFLNLNLGSKISKTTRVSYRITMVKESGVFE